MDFTNRGINQNQTSSQPHVADEGDSNKKEKKSGRLSGGKLARVFQTGLLICGTVLVVAVLLSIATTKKDSGEGKYVNSDRYQAVFLNGGQVYFGKIAKVDRSSIVLSDIFYLRVIQQVQPGQENPQNNFTLAKLGCELHRPQDVMVINREQVIFWENLNDESAENTVPGAIKKYTQTNGDKAQDCNQQQSSGEKPAGNKPAGNKPAGTNTTNNQ